MIGQPLFFSMFRREGIVHSSSGKTLLVRTFFPDQYTVIFPPGYFTATVSISTIAPRGSPFTANAALAG